MNLDEDIRSGDYNCTKALCIASDAALKLWIQQFSPMIKILRVVYNDSADGWLACKSDTM